MTGTNGWGLPKAKSMSVQGSEIPVTEFAAAGFYDKSIGQDMAFSGGGRGIKSRAGSPSSFLALGRHLCQSRALE